MFFDLLPRRIAAFLSLSMIAGGIGLTFWLFGQLSSSQISQHPLPEAVPVSAPAAMLTPSTLQQSTPLPAFDVAIITPEQPAELPDEAPEPVVIGISPTLPLAVQQAVEEVALSNPEISTAPATAISVTLQLEITTGVGIPIYRSVFAAATRFDTVHPTIEYEGIVALWRGEQPADESYQQIVALEESLPMLAELMGAPGDRVTALETVAELIDAAWTGRSTLALLPFDQLTPALVVLAVDGQNPVENANRFRIEEYPLVHLLDARSLDDSADHTQIVEQIRYLSGGGNRQAERLTVVAMTGVTAMVRQTAYQMDRYGATWPAEIVGPELAAADLTTISNEVPFVPGCVTNTNPNNLVFCSAPDYMAALEAVGADLIGLTGNHQNDYGREAALQSLEIYAQAALPVYGGGRNKEEAFAPLYIEHNGNRLAFLGANSYGPRIAWATDTAPGSAEFDLNIMSATIRSIKERDRADVILAELQYQETYDVTPLYDQRQNFRALVYAGADIVTGIQSHVPQAIELFEGSLILYGLGNFFFDQMLGTTREGMIVKHTVYQGRHISTQILTTMIHDYGQPHWANEAERNRILGRVFGASYWYR
jgi:hypothetical protein